MDTRLNGRLALVTGASQGIGAAIARALHREGVKVALLARDRDKLDEVVRDVGDAAIAASGDVMDAESLAAAIRRAESAFGPIDIAVNNVGGR